MPSLLAKQPGVCNLRAGGSVRASGYHVSDLLRSRAIRGKLLPADDEELDFASTDPKRQQAAHRRVQLGLAFESRLEVERQDILFHPGERTHSGIAYNIDGRNKSDGRLVECKLTWKSSRHNILYIFLWMMQVKAYLYADADLSPEVDFHVYWVMGDYSWRGPIYEIITIAFTHEECEQAWEFLELEREYLERKIA